MLSKSEMNIKLVSVALSAFVSLVLFVALTGATTSGLSVPYEYQYDALVAESMIKGVLDTGTSFHNPFLGAPLGQAWIDYPIVQPVITTFIRLLCLTTSHFGVVMNMLFILSFPLAAGFATYAALRMDLSPAVACAVGILYSLAPFHFMRSEHHVELSLYFAVPLAILLIRDTCLGRAALVGRRLGRADFGYLAIAVIVAWTGVYYALMACLLLVSVGLLASIDRRRWMPLINAVLFSAVIVALLAGAGAPNAAYWLRHGRPKNVVRSAADTEKFGLTLAQMLLPVPHHRLGAFDSVRRNFDTNMLPEITTENDDAALGAIASIGLVLLFGMPFIRSLRRLVGPDMVLCWMTIVAFLWATVGGFASALTLLPGGTMLRATNRISIFIAFACLWAIGRVVDRCWRKVPGLASRASLAAGLGVLIVGLGALDQCPGTFTLTDRTLQTRFASDEHLGQAIDASLPSGAMVYNMPYVPFPEGITIGPGDYDEVRPYLHTHHVRYSYAQIRGRSRDSWQTGLLTDPAHFVPALTGLGFSAVLIDRNYLPDTSATVGQIRQIVHDCHSMPIISDDASFVFIPIR